MRPIDDGVADALERFRVLLADGRVKAAHGTPRRRVSTCSGASASTASSTARPGRSVFPANRSQWYGTSIVAPTSVASATASRKPMLPTSPSASR